MPLKNKHSHHLSISTIKEIVMIALAAASVVLLILEIYTALNLADYPWLGTLDLVISIIFFVDFFVHYHLSNHKKTFIKTHWVELFASVPFISPFSLPLTSIKLFSSFSLLHLLRIFRLIIRIRIILEASLEYTRHEFPIYIATLVSLVIFSGAGGFYFFEYGINPNVKSYWDAVWWAVVTSTTIGYGDIYPITPGGQILAIIVMLIGISALGVFIAAIDSFLVTRRFKQIRTTQS
ncbi:MAG: hypothetical protein G01um101416_934 [Microgenomates group bacterium Gr01-1014_16]|nr:MAG: hypothetical protein G01um101416_934 [Microgenomates group bacterium Gr01-1014_16]